MGWEQQFFEILELEKMIILSEKLKIPSMNGYGLEVIDYLPPGRNI